MPLWKALIFFALFIAIGGFLLKKFGIWFAFSIPIFIIIFILITKKPPTKPFDSKK